MKKLLLGCGVVTLLLAIAGGTLAYFYVYLPAREYLGSFAQLQEVPKLNESIRNRAAFTPPATGELTPELVDRFVRAQDAMRERMGARVRELDERYKALQTDGGEGAQPSPREVLSALKDLGALLVEAKRAQVEALNAQGFSLAEYQWTRNTIYQALGLPLGEGLEEIIREATSPGAGGKAAVAVMREVPEINRKLVEPLKEKLGETAPLAFFGL